MNTIHGIVVVCQSFWLGSFTLADVGLIGTRVVLRWLLLHPGYEFLNFCVLEQTWYGVVVVRKLTLSKRSMDLPVADLVEFNGFFALESFRHQVMCVNKFRTKWPPADSANVRLWVQQHVLSPSVR